MVRPGARFLDVGTDHAYLPVYLSFYRLVSFCAATDIACGPLEKAREHIEYWNMTNRIRTRLAPGLVGAEDFAPTDIALAGMGGELIVSILKESPFVKNPSLRLIVQPMTKQAVLRRFLSSAGFAVAEERLVQEEERIYQVFCCSYTGTPYSLSYLEAEVGVLNLQNNGPLLEKLLQRKAEQCKRILQGKQQSKLAEDTEERILLEEIECFRKASAPHQSTPFEKGCEPDFLGR